MDKKLKQALHQAYRVPAPARKAAFLKRHRRRELGRWELIAAQAGYIRWWVWGLSLALFGFILLVAHRLESMGAWYASAVTPFLALLVVMEHGRSRVYQMEELEREWPHLKDSRSLVIRRALSASHLRRSPGPSFVKTLKNHWPEPTRKEAPPALLWRMQTIPVS